MLSKIYNHLKNGTLISNLITKLVRLTLSNRYKNHHLYNCLMYKVYFGFFSSINNPKTFSQKIIHLKDRYINNKLATILADIIAVREYVESTIGGGMLNKLLFTTDNPFNIDYDQLPQQFVMKTNHASNTNIIVKDKSKVNQLEISKQLIEWLNMNFADKYGEMQYYKIEPKILIEEYLKDDGNEFLIDYKFWCFDGRVEFLHIQDSRLNEVGKFVYDRYCFDLNFHPSNLFKESGLNYYKFKKPQSLDAMIEYSRKLSIGLPFVRVDFYEINGEPIFGEMTLTPSYGNNHYLSQDAQEYLGTLINLQLSEKI